MSTPKAPPADPASKQPRTERGRQTLRKLLDAAALEFGEKGFHDASISGITGRAGTALGTFYTYFESKDEVFRALVQDLSNRVRVNVGQALAGDMGAFETERVAFAAFLRFARDHKEIYRIIDEAEFVDVDSYRHHYQSTVNRIMERLQAGIDAGELRDDLGEAHAWAIMGMNVFLGLRYAIWSDEEAIETIAAASDSILRAGIAR